MEKSSENKSNYEVDRARDHYLHSTQAQASGRADEDQPGPSWRGEPKTTTGQSNTSPPPTDVCYLIQELRKMSIPAPPNRTIEKSDFIDFPPDWKGPIPTCQMQSNKKPQNFFSRTMSYLKKKSSSTSSSASAKPSTSQPAPPLYVLAPTQRSKKESVSSSKTETTSTIRSSERAKTPSSSDISKMMPTKKSKTQFDSKRFDIDDIMEE